MDEYTEEYTGNNFVERRSHIRYDVSGNATIFSYLDEGRAYALHTPQIASLINISQGGVRLSMKYNSMIVDDFVQISILFGNKERLLTAHVVNLADFDGYSEYGCELVV